MFEVYAFATPNSIKVLIALEELGLPYRLHGVNVRQSCQKALERDPGSACNWDPFASRVRCG